LKVLPELSELNLERNEISEIIPGTFEKISRLEYLHLDYNKIEHLGCDTFCGLVNLKYIGLEGNKLQYLHPDTFVGLPNLQRLFLSKNSDLQIPNDRHLINSHTLRTLVISGCNVSSMSVQSFANVRTLESIDLGYNYLRSLDISVLKELPELFALNLKWNEISEIIPDSFENFSRLKYLFLDYKKIEHLGSDTFRGLFNLKYIGLMENKLQYLHPDTFFGLPNLQGLLLSYNPDLQIPNDCHFINSHSLKRLVISGCNINSVSVETFSNASALEVLDLSDNYLSHVDINILKVLPELSALYLNFNPLQCDCQLQEVWRWCQDHNIQTAYKEFAPECDTPSEVMGIWWGVLEKGQCSQGNIHYSGDYKNTNYSYTPIEDMDTERQKEENVSSFVKQYKLPIFAILFIFGTSGNVILIIIISCNKDMRTVPNIYILNLAMSDIIYLIGLFSGVWPDPDLRLHGFIMCSFITFCYRMSVGLTAYTIAVLSIQRYRVIANPLHVRVSSHATWLTTGAIICGVWFVAALSAVPEARSRNSCGAITVFGITNYYHYVVVFDLLVSCVIPLCDCLLLQHDGQPSCGKLLFCI
jgi:Leucine-rich repeat (LRR) protein